VTEAELSRSRLDEREAMVASIIANVRATAAMTGKNRLSDRVLDAMRAVPRHEFIPPEFRANAYLDSALPIACEQTISQPFIVALMTELLGPGPDDRILEVGTGSGYQAAVLAEIVKHVYSMELVDHLATTAQTRLRAMGYDNISVTAGDGYGGWPDFAPYDGIIVTAVAGRVPDALKKQLKPSGTLVLPLGSGMHQELTVLKKRGRSKFDQASVLRVSFVPLKHPELEKSI
jgi:protein-L-isoaspartate(D-aspartate) O-methyltransferase